MKKYYRSQYFLLQKRIAEPRRFIQVLAGPRQVGKTTIALQLVETTSLPHHFAAADGALPSDNIWLEQQWETARLKWKQSGADSFLLVIDEIQKIENWSEAVKAQWDADTRNRLPIKILILGSSRLLLQQGLTESLAGRFEITYIPHWSYQEMKEAFSVTVNQFIWFGGYPGATDLISNESRWKQYITNALVETSISKDILMLTRVDKPALMRRLFDLGCAYSGQILSYNKMLGQLLDAGNTTTLSHYLQLLGTAGLLTGLEKFTPNKISQRSSSPKLMPYNTALVSAQMTESFERAAVKPDLWGRMVESAIGAHLLNFALTENFEVFYWSEGNAEIDFVLRNRNQVLGIEVKSGNIQKSAGTKMFKQRFPEARILLVGQTGIQVEEFLSMNPVDFF